MYVHCSSAYGTRWDAHNVKMDIHAIYSHICRWQVVFYARGYMPILKVSLPHPKVTREPTECTTLECSPPGPTHSHAAGQPWCNHDSDGAVNQPRIHWTWPCKPPQWHWSLIPLYQTWIRTIRIRRMQIPTMSNVTHAEVDNNRDVKYKDNFHKVLVNKAVWKWYRCGLSHRI